MQRDSRLMTQLEVNREWLVCMVRGAYIQHTDINRGVGHIFVSLTDCVRVCVCVFIVRHRMAIITCTHSFTTGAVRECNMATTVVKAVNYYVPLWHFPSLTLTYTQGR